MDVLLVVGLAFVGLALLMALGFFLPVVPPRLPGPRMLIDELVPLYSFGEHHEIRIAAPVARVWQATLAVTAREIRLFRLLTWLRSPRWPGGARESILNPAPDRPILEVALRSGFLLLGEDEEREIVVGMLVCCNKPTPAASKDDFLSRPGSLARAVMSFHAIGEGGGTTRLITQTRISTSDATSRRRFAAYWRVIHPGSAFIRLMWLRAIRDRAERPAA